MLDAVAMGTVALTYIGAQVAQKAANGAIQAVWDKLARDSARCSTERRPRQTHYETRRP